MLKYLDLPRRLEGVDLVITAEGSMDLQTLSGKGPMGITRAALEYGVPTIALVGALGEGEDKLYDAGLRAIFPIVPGPMTLEEAMSRGGEFLERTAARTGRILSLALIGFGNGEGGL